VISCHSYEDKCDLDIGYEWENSNVFVYQEHVEASTISSMTGLSPQAMLKAIKANKGKERKCYKQVVVTSGTFIEKSGSLKITIENGGFIEVVTDPVTVNDIKNLYDQVGGYLESKMRNSVVIEDPKGCTMLIDNELIKVKDYYILNKQLRAMGQHSTFPVWIDKLCLVMSEDVKSDINKINKDLLSDTAKGILCWIYDQNKSNPGKYNVRASFNKVINLLTPQEKLMIKNIMKSKKLKEPGLKGEEYPIKTLNDKRMVLFEDRGNMLITANLEASGAKSEFINVMNRVNQEDISKC